MPNYSNATPPYSLSPGDVGFSFSAEAVPAAAQAGQQFALVRKGGAQPGYVVRWQTLFATAPGAISLELQAAMNDVDAEYKSIDTSTQVNGEAKTVTGVNANFLRVKVISSTVSSGAGFTAKILV